MSLLAASLDLCVGHNSSAIFLETCKFAGDLLCMDLGVKLREFPWRKVYPRTELTLRGKKYKILCLSCCLVLRRGN